MPKVIYVGEAGDVDVRREAVGVDLGCGGGEEDVDVEGVETELQRQRLADLGCQLAQGFHLGRCERVDLTQRVQAR